MSKGIKRLLIVVGLLVIAGAATIFFFLRSHSTDDHLRAVPASAVMVMKIDVQQLAVKADPAKLMEQPAFKKMKDQSVVALMTDPLGTGIDPLENIYAFVDKADDGSVVSALVLNVDDDDKLQAFLKQKHLAENVEKNGGENFATLNSSGAAIAWNDESAILLSGNPESLKENALHYLREKKENSISTDDDYLSFIAKKPDIGLYIANNRMSRMPGAELLSSLGLTSGYGEVLINFENDGVNAVYANHQEKLSVPPIIRPTPLQAKQFAAVAPKTPLLYLGLATDINFLLTTMSNDPNMQETVLGLEMSLGLTQKQLTKLFTGDITIAVTDFRDIATYDPRLVADAKIAAASGEDAPPPINVPMIYISMGETDDAKTTGILEGLGMQKAGAAYCVPGFDFIVYASAKDGHLLITNDYFAADSLGTTGKLSGKLPAEVNTQTPVSGWADLDPAHFPESFTQPDGDPMMAMALPALQPFRSLSLEGKSDRTELKLKMTPGEGNSLYRLISYYATLAN